LTGRVAQLGGDARGLVHDHLGEALDLAGRDLPCRPADADAGEDAAGLVMDGGADAAQPRLMLGVAGGTTAFTVMVDASLAVASAADVAVITVIPAATAVTTPVVALTVATAGLLDAKVAAWLVELVTTTVIASVWPTFSVAASGNRLSDTGAGGVTVVVSSHAAPSNVAPSMSPSNPNLRVVISAPPRSFRVE